MTLSTRGLSATAELLMITAFETSSSFGSEWHYEP